MAINANTWDLSGANGQGGLESSAVGIAVAAGAVYVRLFVVKIVGRHGRVGIRLKNTGGAALTDMRLIRSLRKGGMELDDFTVVAENGDFATLTNTLEIQNVIPAAINTMAAGAKGDLIVNAAGVAEYAVEVKCGGAGTVMDASVVVD